MEELDKSTINFVGNLSIDSFGKSVKPEPHRSYMNYGLDLIRTFEKDFNAKVELNYVQAARHFERKSYWPKTEFIEKESRQLAARLNGWILEQMKG